MRYINMLLAGILIATGVTLYRDHPNFCFPENNLYISVNQKSLTGGITHASFDHVIDIVEEIYKPIISDLGGEFTVERKWEDGTVNAYAQRKGKVYSVSMFGGLARHETITQDAFAYVICHEVGHHLGGAPKIKTWYQTVSWASDEGQSDYWGGNKCLKRVYKVLEERSLNLNDPDYRFAKAECEKRYDNKDEKMICIRTSMAGKSLADLFAALRKMPKPPHFYTSDKSIVTATFHKHPQPQCRMDTYLAASLCEKDYNDHVSNTDPETGSCIRKDGYKLEARPLCWYKPKQ